MKDKQIPKDLKKEVEVLNLYRRGWSKDMAENCFSGMRDANQILFDLYQVSSAIILIMEDTEKGKMPEKILLFHLQKRLEEIVKSEDFDFFASLNELGASNVIDNTTRHHIRVMFALLRILSK